MIFNSLHFLFFFPIFLVGYFFLPKRLQRIWLLLGSCYFYMAFVPKYILILFGVIIVDYWMGRAIEGAEGKRKKWYFLVSIFSNIGVLFLFKYFNFFNENIAHLASLLHWNYSANILRIALPIGLSFHVFQSLAYVIEVYQGRHKSEKSFLTYALYVMFFPQLVAGPIERPQHLLHQFRDHHPFDADSFFRGANLMLWGFFKKVFIADRLALFVDQVYGNLHEQSGISLVIAVVFFTFQLYADFSGYSDIAIGAARVLGYDLSQNFSQPYLSKSIAEFWRRWHISLSGWFRDYLYFPLAFRFGSARWKLHLALILTFLVSGLWHGAGWTFIIMGLLHGVYITVGTITKSYRDAAYRALGLLKYEKLRTRFQRVFVFCLVSVSWIYFRAPSLSDAFYITTHLFRGWGGIISNISSREFMHERVFLRLNGSEFVLSIAGIFLLIFAEAILEEPKYRERIDALSPLMRGFAYAFPTLCIITLGVFQQKEFIYFQF